MLDKIFRKVISTCGLPLICEWLGKNFHSALLIPQAILDGQTGHSLRRELLAWLSLWCMELLYEFTNSRQSMNISRSVSLLTN